MVYLIVLNSFIISLAILWPTLCDIVTHSNWDDYAVNRDIHGLACMRCRSRNTKHTGGCGLFSGEFPEFDLFWLKTKLIFSEFV